MHKLTVWMLLIEDVSDTWCCGAERAILSRTGQRSYHLKDGGFEFMSTLSNNSVMGAGLDHLEVADKLSRSSSFSFSM